MTVVPSRPTVHGATGTPYVSCGFVQPPGWIRPTSALRVFDVLAWMDGSGSSDKVFTEELAISGLPVDEASNGLYVSDDQRFMSPLTGEHLARLSVIAHADYENSSSVDRSFAVICQSSLPKARTTLGVRQGRWRGPCRVVVLFLPQVMTTFPVTICNMHVGFGPSVLERHGYDFFLAQNGVGTPAYADVIHTAGRRVDLLVCGLSGDLQTDPVGDRVPDATRREDPPALGPVLAKEPIVVIDPATRRDEVIWPPHLGSAVSQLLSKTDAVVRWPGLAFAVMIGPSGHL